MVTPGIGHNSEMDEELPDFSDLENMSVQDILRAGQKALFVQLVGRCRSGQANHQEMAILRNILRDNGLTLGIPPESTEVAEEPAELPSFEPPEYE